MRKTIAREIAVALLFIALSVAMTWPLARNLSTAISVPGDPLCLTWVLDWDYYATSRGLPLFDANIFFPARHALAFSEHMYGIALFVLPLFAIGIAPLTIHNIALLAGFAGCGYAMYRLAEWVTGSAAAAFVGGIVFAFIGIRFHHLPHLPYVWSMWLPVLLLASLRLVREPTIRRCLVLAAALILNGLTALHWFVFGTFTVAATILLVGGTIRGFKELRFWALAAASFSIAAIVLAPFLLPYAKVAHSYGMQRSFGEILPNGVRWRDWFIPNLQSKLYGALSPGDAYGHERTLFPGLVTYALIGVALVRYRRPTRRAVYAIDVAIGAAGVASLFGAMAGDISLNWGSHRLLGYSGITTPFLILIALLALRVALERYERLEFAADRSVAGTALLWIVIGACGARGLYGVLHTFLYRHVEAFQGLRMPARWVMIAYVGLALLAAIGMARMIGGRGKGHQALLTVIVAAALLSELRAAPIRWFLTPIEPREVYRWLRDVRLQGGVIELPMTQYDAYTYLWRATEHHQRLLNGVSSYTPPHYDRLQRSYDETPIADSFLEQLHDLRCSLIVVHGDPLGARSDAVREWLRKSISTGRISFVRRFDAGLTGDYVFALNGNEPAASRWRAPEVADSSGRTPAATTDAFLNGSPVYTNEPFAKVEVGPPIGTTRGKLTVSGWAVAPAGVSVVNLRFANGRIVLAADRSERDDIRRLLPWYPHDPLPGFTRTFGGPPRSIQGDTDMQVEVIDLQGRSVRFAPFWFRWIPASKNRIVWNENELSGLLDRLSANVYDNRERVLKGSAAIHDFTPALLRDSEAETDSAFAERVLRTVFDAAPDRRLMDRCVEMLNAGTSRERVIHAIFRSREFQQQFVSDGHIVID